jgi:nucleoside-diphosphate-sugar epimerase
MRLLVTGGAGFVGSNVCLALRARHPDWEVVALDNLYRRGSELNLPRFREAGVRFVHADVRSPGDLAAAGPFDAMVECSAEPSVMAGGDVIVPVNLLGAFHCFEAAKAHGASIRSSGSRRWSTARPARGSSSSGARGSRRTSRSAARGRCTAPRSWPPSSC